MSRNPQPGEDAFIHPQYSKRLAKQSALAGLSTQTEPTPDPSGDKEHEVGGIVRRANEFRTNLGPVALESIGLHGMEISKAIKQRADELYRNQFPRFEPRFTRKCTDCGCEYDEEIERCDECNAPTREPSQQQRTDAEEFFRSVNREGQSLRELYKFLARDAGRLGVWVHVVKKTYGVINGEVIERIDELVRADSKRIKPVVDTNGRIGGHWWACPVHRPPHGDHDVAEGPGRCDECGADLREVHFAEVEEISDDEPTKVYFEDEVITHAPFEPLLAGHDGLSPVAPIWLKQAILEWMDLYAAGFYDQENTNRFPGKMGFVHTTNKTAVEKQLEMAQDEKDEDAYAQGFIYNEIPRGAEGSTNEVQVIDMMSDEILGQSDQLKKDYKSDIRSVYGLTDAQDSELEDAGGLNNEGLQLEVNDREKAAAQQDLRDGPLQKLMDVLGYDDWQLTFVPPQREEEEPSTLETIQAAATAKQNGIPIEIEDGQVEILDTDGPMDVDDHAGEDAASDGPDDDPPTEVDPPDASVDVEAAGTGGPRNADESYADRDEALRTLEEGFKHLVWPTNDELIGLEQQSREPFFADDEDMPQFVEDLVEEAIERGVIHLGQYDAANVTGNAVKDFLEDQLTQPQGWSLRSLAENFADRWKISVEEAMDTLRPQVASVLNESRKIGYEQLPESDERLFKWIGPDDEETTDACEWMKKRTNPKYGGDPVTLDELEDLIEEAQSRWFPSFSGDMAVHYNERHTFVQHYD
ncbi:hypothetical protein [Natrinema thermotolerans]|uniref:hypothetical protein n=1 Tax=Natrinema thermotolerans TaxID=121872 RepID=UPI000679D818|nr:hypothetical protein [Natrinema thermotolerans]QCC57355.1 hypothetical protein DVR14_01350 [Natrinema thermotolerans]